MPDAVFTEPSGFAGAGTPIAGNFDGNAANGDEIGWFNGSQWRFDTDRDFIISDNNPLTTTISGLPFVGDFDGNGSEDLGTYNQVTNTFNVLMNPNFNSALPLGGTLRTFQISDGFPFAGVRDRPVAGDFNGDGFDDIGLWAPDRSGVPVSEAAEWYIFVSGDVPVVSPTVGNDRIVNDLTTGTPVLQFTPEPFGGDLFAQFGDDFAVPIVGNFDPPVNGGGNSVDPQIVMEGDFSNDGSVGQEDYDLWISSFGATVTPGAIADGNGDGRIDAADYTVWRNNLGATSTSLSLAVTVAEDGVDEDAPAVADVLLQSDDTPVSDYGFEPALVEDIAQEASPLHASFALLASDLSPSSTPRSFVPVEDLSFEPIRNDRWLLVQTREELRSKSIGVEPRLVSSREESASDESAEMELAIAEVFSGWL